jgi:hypothetical protein
MEIGSPLCSHGSSGTAEEADRRLLAACRHASTVAKSRGAVQYVLLELLRERTARMARCSGLEPTTIWNENSLRED